MGQIISKSIESGKSRITSSQFWFYSFVIEFLFCPSLIPSDKFVLEPTKFILKTGILVVIKELDHLLLHV